MTGVLLLLGVAMASALVAERLPLPYTVILVVVGVVLGAAGVSPGFTLDRDLILQVFLPLLLFEAGLQIDLDALRQVLPAVLLLAVPGIILSTVVVAAALVVGAGIGWRDAALFGALVSATDPVAVTALFKRLHASPRLAMIVEGESVLNDATALALFALLLPVAQGGSFAVPLLLGKFVLVLIGGLVVGALAGLAGAWLVRLYSYPLPELLLSALVAYGAYLIADRANFSGVIATAAAGVVFVRAAQPGLTPLAGEIMVDVWEFAAFLTNSLLFLLIGLTVRLDALGDVASTLAWAIGGALIGRLAVVLLSALLLRLRHDRSLWRNGPVVFWSGLRGGLSIALALSLPADFAARSLLLRLTLGLVLFTLLVQGATIRPLLLRVQPRD